MALFDNSPKARSERSIKNHLLGAIRGDIASQIIVNNWIKWALYLEISEDPDKRFKVDRDYYVKAVFFFNLVGVHLRDIDLNAITVIDYKMLFHFFENKRKYGFSSNNHCTEI